MVASFSLFLSLYLFSLFLSLTLCTHARVCVCLRTYICWSVYVGVDGCGWICTRVCVHVCVCVCVCVCAHARARLFDGHFAWRTLEVEDTQSYVTKHIITIFHLLFFFCTETHNAPMHFAWVTANYNVCLSVCMSVRPSVHLSICLSLYPSFPTRNNVHYCTRTIALYSVCRQHT